MDCFQTLLLIKNNEIQKNCKSIITVLNFLATQ